jgi:hypothetical protein
VASRAYLGGPKPARSRTEFQTTASLYQSPTTGHTLPCILATGFPLARLNRSRPQSVDEMRSNVSEFADDTWS